MTLQEKDKAFFQAGLQQLETYILSKELFWPSTVHTTDFTQITLGAMLLVRERLKGWKTPQIREFSMEMDAVRLKWRAAWDEKAGREVRTRVQLWKNYLQEAGNAPAEFTRQYPYQVRLRVILALLLDELREPPPDSLIQLDHELQHHWKNDTFVWDPEIAWVFPEKDFWFLYGTPNQQE